MDMGFLVGCPFAPLGMPHIRFLFVGSRFCSTLPSDLLSRGSPCASLNLHLHQVGWGTSTPKLSNMPSIQPPPTKVGGFCARRLKPTGADITVLL